MTYYLKIVCGYDEERHFPIKAQEAHKAYYLFEHPDKRGIFDNGLALTGKEIKIIQPDYHTTMGWNTTHELNDDDWNQLNGQGVVEKMKEIMGNAKDVSMMIDKKPELAGMQLGDIIKEKSNLITFPQTEKLAEQFRIEE